MFCAFIPVPFQMLLAAIGAVILRVNILVAVPTVWITNPFTMTPIFYFCYLVGVQMLDTDTNGFEFELSFDWLLTGLLEIWQPFLLGCFVVGAIASVTSFILIRMLWRFHLVSHIKQRAKRKHNIKQI